MWSEVTPVLALVWVWCDILRGDKQITTEGILTSVLLLRIKHRAMLSDT
jgi:hypothetical protein